MPRQRLTDLRDQIITSFAGHHADGAAAIAGAKARIHKAGQRARKNKEAYYADALSLEDFKLEQDKTKAGIAAAEKIIAKWSIELDSIRASLDEALSLMIDPYLLFIEAPDQLRLMLTQAIFDKLWIMGPQIAGAELTDTYHELLTMEARLAEQANQQAQSVTDGPVIVTATPPHLPPPPHSPHRPHQRLGWRPGDLARGRTAQRPPAHRQPKPYLNKGEVGFRRQSSGRGAATLQAEWQKSRSPRRGEDPRLRTHIPSAVEELARQQAN